MNILHCLKKAEFRYKEDVINIIGELSQKLQIEYKKLRILLTSGVLSVSANIK